ncbi:zf-TFIIB domain-containing protein [Longitalea luteola]|uniref:TFIIB-type zinc ribbon-containing protein n=1 Tax=Longitalea luteola TaxID=2812563 RepID=UPI001A958888|nr:zf-TFIIB domain-containing protein [Longitalea luteola]
MNCPNCNEVLVMTERQGVEIDYCPKCRGIWLDRGELDKIIEKSGASGSTYESDRYDSDRYRGEQKDYDSYKDQNHPNYRKKKKGGFLSDLFDFD